jgi:hypothetical protein
MPSLLSKPYFYPKLSATVYAVALFAVSSSAAGFTIEDGETATTMQDPVNGETSTINSGGAITTSANPAAVYKGSASDVTVINNGAITQTQWGRHGIYFYSSAGGSTNTVTNNGTITLEGRGSAGYLFYSGTGNDIMINNGTITAEGNTSYGMFAANQALGSTTLINNGTITMEDYSSYGIYARTTYGTHTVTNSGTITTSGSNSHGIYHRGGSGTTTITNSGTINVTGSGSVGIKIDRAGTINNSGTISATGDATKAIEATGDYDNTLNLLSGSTITGTIDLGGGTDTVNISGTQVINGCEKSACMSASLFTNAEIINIDSSVDAVVSSGVVATVDPTGSSVLGVSLSTMTSAVHDVVSQRMARTSRMRVSGRGLSSWGQTIGAYRSRGTEGSAMGHNHSYVGFTGGTEKKLKQGRVGVIAGYASSSVSTKEMSNSTNTNSFFGGIYGDLYLGRQISLTTSLLGGYEYHDNIRNVRNGSAIEDAKSDFSSTFFSPSVTLSSTHPFEIAGRQFAFRPSTTAVYTIAQYDNYQEKGTTGSNLAVSDRTVQALKIRTQLAVAISLNKHSEFELRSGFTTRHTDHDDIKASLGSTSFQFAGAGNNSVQGGFVGGSLRLHATENLRASVDVKFRGAGGRESEFIGRAGVSYNF